MEYKDKVKYLDIVIKNIENTEMFDVDNILYKLPELKETYKDISYSIRSFGVKNNLFSKIIATKGSSWYKLTTKGENLKEFKKGFIKFEKSLTKIPLTLYQKIHLPITIISLLGTLTFSYFTFDYKGKNNNLINEKIILKDSINKLKLKIELYKVLSLKDTLHTNN
ncbi:hypothetical protein [Polaribacter ponticola]|uniref:Uncharacterized protein n=1 Tax=Polaribacter ponticola TaxID=2978475 RepID=A0ABT5S6R7_9FLAO|nr:hypothetical protein [Polaribacter sp. MSW5]MDD7913795.1 hypothetical protein [Polaribacter sp. MSW5]